MLTTIIISARLNEVNAKILFLKEQVVKARKLKGKDISTPILDKRIYIKVAEARILQWVLSSGS